MRTTTHDDPRVRTTLSYGCRTFGAVFMALALMMTACVPTARSAIVDGLDLRYEATTRPLASAGSSGANSSSIVARPPSPPVSPLPLRGDVAFDPDGLEDAARFWYDELWDTLTDPEYVNASTTLARRDDLYHYGRSLHSLINAVLTAFRVTGDLALLDEVDRLTEHMRAQLKDGWRDTADRTSGTTDGYLNWVYRGGDSSEHQGKDIHVFDEMRTHALVAEFTWAFHNNRDLSSPSGVPYGERADVWQTYLLEHFEAKWRERNQVRGDALPFLEHDSLHTNVAFAKYHHYVGLLRDSARHRDEAARLTRRVLDHFVTVSVDGTSALVWPRRLEASGDEHYLQPTTYARYVVMDAVTLHLEGAGAWSDRSIIDGMAATIRSLVVDASADEFTFARDVGGGVTRGGIPPTLPSEFEPIAESRFASSSYAFVAAWDPTGSLASWTHLAHERHSRRARDVHLPAAMLLAMGGARHLEADAQR